MGKEIRLNALDLFAGAGGFSAGVEQAGIDVKLMNIITLIPKCWLMT